MASRFILQIDRISYRAKVSPNYSADEKVAILRSHLIDRVSVSDLFEEMQIQPSLLTLPKIGRH